MVQNNTDSVSKRNPYDSATQNDVFYLPKALFLRPAHTNGCNENAEQNYGRIAIFPA